MPVSEATAEQLAARGARPARGLLVSADLRARIGVPRGPNDPHQPQNHVREKKKVERELGVAASFPAATGTLPTWWEAIPGSVRLPQGDSSGNYRVRS